METQGRIEHRFFFSLEDLKIIEKRLIRHPRLSLSRFVFPVTETIYFLFKETQKFPRDFYIRMRRYIDNGDSKIFIDQKSLFSLEIKTKDEKGTSKVMKIRTSINGRSAIRILEHPEKNEMISELPALFPGVATQAERTHFVHNNCDLRITLDRNISFFGFSDMDRFHGYGTGTLREAKMEFKYEKADEIMGMRAFKNEIFRGCQYHQETNLYLEKEVLKCRNRWLRKQ